MFSYNCCPSTPDPCRTLLSSNNCTNDYMTTNRMDCRPANCFRPLQQLYKTVYSPMYGNKASHMNIACICRPAERYKTTNMTYGSFYYDNWPAGQKNGPMNYDRAVFARCYDNNRSACQSTNNDRSKNSFTVSNPFDTQENQYWTQPTSDVCCPVNCCTNTSNCNTDPCSALLSQKPLPSCL